MKGPAYIDDLPILRIAPAVSIVDDAARNMSIAHDTFFGYGFELNCGAGKTKMLVEHGGKGAVAARSRLVECKGRVPCVYENNSFILEVVDSYGPLGTKTTTQLALEPDMSKRNGSMRQRCVRSQTNASEIRCPGCLTRSPSRGRCYCREE